MWDDFEASVNSMIRLLTGDTARRTQSLEWWSGRQWSVQLLTIPAGVTTTASVGSSATAIAFPPQQP
jgi:hypothetical protein